MSQTPGRDNTHPRINSQSNIHDNNIVTPINTQKSLNEKLLASNKSTSKSIPNTQNNMSRIDKKMHNILYYHIHSGRKKNHIEK